MKLKRILIEGGIMLGVLLIIILISILMLNQMEERIRTECEKVNYEGIVHFLDADVDCVQFSNLSNITEIENGNNR